jgi:hypothetical protein
MSGPGNGTAAAATAYRANVYAGEIKTNSTVGRYARRDKSRKPYMRAACLDTKQGD